MLRGLRTQPKNSFNFQSQAGTQSRPCLLSLEPPQAVKSVGVREAGSEMGARTVGGGVTWFPHPGQTHPDLVSREASRGGGEKGQRLSINDLRFHLHTGMRLRHGFGGSKCCTMAPVA